MPKKPLPQPERDINATAVKLVAGVTDTRPESGEELLGSPKLQRKLREAKEKENAKS